MRSPSWRWLWLLPAAWLCNCALNLENPEDEAKDLIDKKVPTSLEVLTGRWIGDSTYANDDVRGYGFPADMEVFLDSTVHAVDTSLRLFQGAFNGRFTLREDTLVMRPVSGSAKADTYHVHITFLGNYLRLHRPADFRYAHFHRRRGPDSTQRDSLLRDGLWAYQGRRTAVDSFVPTTFLREFTYLEFPSDSLRWDVRVDGISTVAAGTIATPDRNWVGRWDWGLPDGMRRLAFDLVSFDSLRVWPLNAAGGADLGYSLFRKVPFRARWDLDITPSLGYWRTDTIAMFGASYSNHLGKYFDVEIRRDHTVKTLTNMEGYPVFDSWSIDSGFLFLDGPGGKHARMTIKSRGGDSLVVAADSGSAFPFPRTFTMSRVDGSRFEEHPLERFPEEGYVHIAAGADSIRYYFAANFDRAAQDRHEIALLDSNKLRYLGLRISAGAETNQGSQEGFLFAFQANLPSLGLFTCRSQPSLPLTVRVTSGSDPLFATGQINGSCRVTVSEKPPADSTLPVDGTFRFRRKTLGGMDAPYW